MKILFLELETTGFPRGPKNEYTNLDNYNKDKYYLEKNVITLCTFCPKDLHKHENKNDEN